MDVPSDVTMGQWSIGWMRMHGGRMRDGWVMYWQVSNY